MPKRKATNNGENPNKIRKTTVDAILECPTQDKTRALADEIRGMYFNLKKQPNDARQTLLVNMIRKLQSSTRDERQKMTWFLMRWEEDAYGGSKPLSELDQEGNQNPEWVDCNAVFETLSAEQKANLGIYSDGSLDLSNSTVFTLIGMLNQRGGKRRTRKRTRGKTHKRFLSGTRRGF